MKLKLYIDNKNNTISHFELININDIIVFYKSFNELIHKEMYSNQYLSGNNFLKKDIFCMNLIELKEMVLVRDNEIIYIKIPIFQNKFALYKMKKELSLSDFSIDMIDINSNIIEIVDFSKLLKECKQYCDDDTLIEFIDNKIILCKNDKEYTYEQLNENTFKINDNIYNIKEFEFKDMSMMPAFNKSNLRYRLSKCDNNIKNLFDIIKDRIII